MTDGLNTNSIALSGEFYVLAQLVHHGLTASLTLGPTKEVDILVFNPRTSRQFRVEVKTRNGPPKRDDVIHGKPPFYIWGRLSKKHESIIHKEKI